MIETSIIEYAIGALTALISFIIYKLKFGKRRTLKAEILFKYLKDIESQCIREKLPGADLSAYIKPESRFDYLTFKKNKLSRGKLSIDEMYDEHYLAECAKIAPTLLEYVIKQKKEYNENRSKNNKFIDEVLSQISPSMDVKEDTYR